MRGNKIKRVVVSWLKMTENRAYSFDGQHETSISEEDDKDRNTKVAGEHVHDVGLVVVARS